MSKVEIGRGKIRVRPREISTEKVQVASILVMRFTLLLLLLAFVLGAGDTFANSQNNIPAIYQLLPFDKLRHELYTRDELWKEYDSDPNLNKSFDWQVFKYFTMAAKYNPPFDELLAQRSHDSGMDVAINRYFQADEQGVPTNKKIIVILGSHSKLRNDLWYRKIARLAYELTQAGYFVVTGGGPGLMEAAHLGAYMANYGMTELDDALSILAKSSVPANSSIKQYEMLDYWEKSRMVVAKYPQGADSLGIPTWFYGHEGANGFSTHVAKYFSNALREEKICSLSFYGAIFAPGGPGTLQEAFMDAAQNGYGSYNWYSPMIFFSDLQSATDMQTLIESTTTPAYKALGMVTRTTEPSSVLAFLKMRPPVPKSP